MSESITPTVGVSNEEKVSYIPIEDKETGEETLVPMKRFKTIISVQSRYASDNPFTFSKGNKAKTWLDSRDNKRVSSCFMESEMNRIVGKEQTESALKQLQEV